MTIKVYGGEDDVRLAQTRLTALQAGGGLGKGTSGDATVSIRVGQTTTLAPGTSATVTNSGNDVDAVFNFGIPGGTPGQRGEQGLQGVQGVQGEPGIQGLKGDPGDPGIQGIKGDKGDQGVPGQDGTFEDIPDAAISRAKLDSLLLAEIRYDQFIASWTGNQVITNGVVFNLLSLLTPTSITRNTFGLVFDNTAKLIKFVGTGYDQNVRMSVRLTGTIGGAANTPREFFVELTRPGAGGAIVARDGIIKISDGNINSRQATLDTYVSAGITDLFVTQGFDIKLNNVSTQNVTLTGMSILVFG